MPITSRYLFTASMDVEPAKEALFNEVYDREHVPTILKVPGVISALRFKRRPLEMILGGDGAFGVANRIEVVKIFETVLAREAAGRGRLRLSAPAARPSRRRWRARAGGRARAACRR